MLKIAECLSVVAIVTCAATATTQAFPIDTGTIAVPLSSRVAMRDLGRAPANYPVSIVVTLSYRHAAQLERLIEAQGDPESPFYHHFLTPEQFASIYGPTPQDESSAVRVLRREGFTIARRFSNRTVIDATAPAVVAERYFHTEIHLARQSDGVHYFNSKSASVPSELSARAFAVTGLSNLRTVSPSPPQAPGGMRADQKGLGQPLENEGGFGPLALARGYDLPVEHGYTGKGVKVAEIENSEPVGTGYIPEFSWAFGFPLPTGSTGASTTLVRVDGGCTSLLTCGAEGTSSVDYSNYTEYQEYLAALAPGIDAYLYQIPDDTTTSWTDGLNAVVSDNHADIIALGDVEHYETDPNSEAFALALDHVIQQGDAIGMTFISPSITSFATGGPVSAIPNDSPYVLSVGASNIQVSGSGAYHSEAALLGSTVGASISEFFPQPSYKSSISGAMKNGREQPDVVAAQMVERSTASAIPLYVYAGSFMTYSGYGVWNTSFVSGSAEPLVALVADIDQMIGSRSGLINSTIFSLYRKKQYGPASAPFFRDITKLTPGEGGGSISPSSPFHPAKGYDFVTGIGSVDGWNLAQAIGKKK